MLNINNLLEWRNVNIHTIFSDLIAAEISGTRSMLNTLKMVADNRPMA
jgi:hypothetical protein